MNRKKSEIRRFINKKRIMLTPSEAKERGHLVEQRLMKTDLYCKAQCICCYVSVKNEVDTHHLIRTSLCLNKKVGVPKTTNNGQIINIEIHAFSDLKPTSIGLMEPLGESLTKISPINFDLIVVPGIAFDKKGNRVGFGGGFYDRFLGLTTAPKVGLAYDFQLLEDLPIDDHDFKLDFLFTESTICTF